MVGRGLLRPLWKQVAWTVEMKAASRLRVWNCILGGFEDEF